MLKLLLLNALLPAVAVAQVATNSSEGNPGSVSKMPYGQVIKSCTTPGAFALTFDDGPFEFTMTLLDTLKAAGVKATFFINGNNFDRVENRVPELKRMLDEGHQIGSHTDKHPDFNKISGQQVREEMTALDEKLIKLINKSPTYMRPPFFHTTNESLKVLGEMQYHVINADLDSFDWNFTTPENNNEAFKNFQAKFDNSTMSLMHDVHKTTVELLVPKVLPILKDSGRTAMTVGECLGDPKENWYRNGPVKDATPATGVKPVQSADCKRKRDVAPV
ncbi:hypothetical protein ED733_001647 [Metarhizium rileyi]|uniref:NodB homology domain-containing protein n=1 Tax=Metarhizium rileyi (strain RCEF 4871) TaxID=1649241 RepID=A0A5C6G415_METRR|nr:hypothetical protein ED733_001647 [Metarhizium rileyi]